MGSEAPGLSRCTTHTCATTLLCIQVKWCLLPSHMAHFTVCCGIRERENGEIAGMGLRNMWRQEDRKITTQREAVKMREKEMRNLFSPSCKNPIPVLIEYQLNLVTSTFSSFKEIWGWYCSQMSCCYQGPAFPFCFSLHSVCLCWVTGLKI